LFACAICSFVGIATAEQAASAASAIIFSFIFSVSFCFPFGGVHRPRLTLYTELPGQKDSKKSFS
jgi:hypothetical protein